MRLTYREIIERDGDEAVAIKLGRNRRSIMMLRAGSLSLTWRTLVAFRRAYGDELDFDAGVQQLLEEEGG